MDLKSTTVGSVWVGRCHIIYGFLHRFECSGDENKLHKVIYRVEFELVTYNCTYPKTRKLGPLPRYNIAQRDKQHVLKKIVFKIIVLAVFIFI